MKRENLVGQRFGKLTVTKMLYNYNNTNKTKCLCDCDCGKKDILRTPYTIKKATSSSCGCGKKEYIIERHGRDIIGEKFGRLLVLDVLWDNNPPLAICECECGNIVTIRKNDVQSLHTKSCGCLKKETFSKINYKNHSGTISEYGIKILYPTRKNSRGTTLWMCECGICHKNFEEIPARVLNNHIRSCGCLNTSSKEKYIENILIKHNISFLPQYTFKDLKLKYVLRFDFGILKNKKLFYLIEYDGEQHFHPVEIFGGEKGFAETQMRDNMKNEYCKKNNIPLLRLPYTLTNEDIEEKITNIIYP